MALCPSTFFEGLGLPGPGTAAWQNIAKWYKISHMDMNGYNDINPSHWSASRFALQVLALPTWSHVFRLLRPPRDKCQACPHRFEMVRVCQDTSSICMSMHKQSGHRVSELRSAPSIGSLSFSFDMFWCLIFDFWWMIVVFLVEALLRDDPRL